MVRTFRNDRFLAINDGSTIKNLQLVVQREDFDESSLLKQLNTGAAIKAEGKLVESQGGGQSRNPSKLTELLGGADPDEFQFR